ncbi:MAG: EI24 domain-containing protein [Nocardioidaceae bacterium]|nr:EI24 domain-containing protein [Nocardioidaceae bacterium]MCL2613819.1 EI24 domain-containing protein [Nocardioidaceae bacterium]
MAAVGAVAGLGHGISLLVRGQSLWRRRPGLMLLGLVPAVVVAALMLTLLVLLAVYVDDLVAWATPFAGGWASGVREAFRVLVDVVLVVGAGFLFVIAFTGLTMALGDSFYERIWMAVERELGGDVPERGVGWVRGAADGVVLVGIGMVASAAVFVVGLLPVVGTIAGMVLGVAVSGHALASELVSRPLEARGYDRRARAALLRRHRGSLLGFGIGVQLCFLVPLGGILVMPGAVAGATYLAREALEV